MRRPIPRVLLRHRITVEPYLGADATGPLYGPAVALRCLVEQRRRTVRAPDGRTVVAGSTIRTELVTGGRRLDDVVTAEARVTYRGQQVEVLTVAVHDGGGLPTPDHIEITVQ